MLHFKNKEKNQMIHDKIVIYLESKGFSCKNLQLDEKTLKDLIIDKHFSISLLLRLFKVGSKKLGEYLELYNLKKYFSKYSHSPKLFYNIVYGKDINGALQVKESKEKFEKTCMDHYGVKHPFAAGEIIAGLRDNWNSKTEEEKQAIKDKIANTNNAKSDEEKLASRLKISNSHLSRPKEDIEKSNEKRKKTCFEIYGGPNPMFSDEILEKQRINRENKPEEEKQKQKDKTRETYRKKCGRDSHSQKHLKHYKDINEGFWRANFVKDGYFLHEECMEYHNFSYSHVNKKKVEFGILEHKKSVRIKAQTELAERLKEKYPELTILQNNRNILKIGSFKELDIVIPEKNFAIEYNGTMFHSFGISDVSKFNNIHKDSQDHFTCKTEACDKLGILLIHCDEYLDPIKRELLNKHIENIIESRPIDISWFSEWKGSELWVDRRYANQKMIEDLGFKFLRVEEPESFWFMKNSDEFFKSQIKEEILFENGFRKIYNCGYLIFER
jgi:AraC-like DNA-binding protein